MYILKKKKNNDGMLASFDKTRVVLHQRQTATGHRRQKETWTSPGWEGETPWKIGACSLSNASLIGGASIIPASTYYMKISQIWAFRKIHHSNESNEKTN